MLSTNTARLIQNIEKAIAATSQCSPLTPNINRKHSPPKIKAIHHLGLLYYFKNKNKIIILNPINRHESRYFVCVYVCKKETQTCTQTA